MTLSENFFSSNLEHADKDLFQSISQELSRQQNQIELHQLEIDKTEILLIIDL